MATGATTPTPANLSLVTITALSSSSSTGISLATPGTASSANPTPTTANSSAADGSSNWSELVRHYADKQVQSKDHQNYPNSPYRDLLTHGNNPKTRLLMISSNTQDDEKLKEMIKNDPLKRANDVHIIVLPLEGNANFKKDEFISEVKHDHRPTMFAFKSKDKKFNEILEALQNNGLILKQLTEAEDGNIFFEAQNINLKEQEPVIQGFTVASDGNGIKETLKGVLKNNKTIANDKSTKVLIINGSHGSRVKSKGKVAPIDGKSGLSDQRYLNQQFYAEDCYIVGLEPIPSEFHAHPCTRNHTHLHTCIPTHTCTPDHTCRPDHSHGDFHQWKSPAGFKRPSIIHSATPCTPLPLDSLLNDPKLNKMQFQVVDLSWYHNRQDLRGMTSTEVAKRSSEFARDVVDYNPTIVLLAYCFSSNGDVAMALRSAGLFDAMILQYELREISQNNQAILDTFQVETLKQVCKKDVKNVVFFGSNGVGKTLLGAAAVKYRAAFEKMNAKYLSPDRETNIEIIVVHMPPYCSPYAMSDDAELLKVLERKYFLGFEAYNVEFVCAQQICHTLGMKDENTIGRIKAICKAKNIENKAKKSNGGGKTVTIFMFDEVVLPAKAQKEIDCTGLVEVERFNFVRTVTCIAPRGDIDNFTVKFPNSPSFYSRCLTVCYRNAKGIRHFNNFVADHSYSVEVPSRENDTLGLYLPPGPNGKLAVTWIQVKNQEDLGKAAKQMVQECGNDNVVVIYETNKDDVTKVVAQESGANKIFDEFDFVGCENQAVIIIINNYLFLELTSRAMNRLIMISGPNLDSDDLHVLNLAKERQHVHTDQVFGSSSSGRIKCSENPCPWSNRDEYHFPLVDHVVFSPLAHLPQEYSTCTKKPRLCK